VKRRSHNAIERRSSLDHTVFCILEAQRYTSARRSAILCSCLSSVPTSIWLGSDLKETRPSVHILSNSSLSPYKYMLGQQLKLGPCHSTKWHWGRFSPSTSVSPANPHSTNYSIIIDHPGLYNRPTLADVPSGFSLTPPRETKKKLKNLK
jgi:hypothetical protein